MALPQVVDGGDSLKLGWSL